MRALTAGILLILALAVNGQNSLSAVFQPSQTLQSGTAIPLDPTIRGLPIDPSTPLESRIQAPTPEILQLFARARQASPTTHPLSADEQRKVSAAFAALPPVHRRILGEHLRAVAFVDGISVSAVTMTINLGEPNPVYDIVIRSSVLHQTASEWLTEKERTVFSSVNSTLSVSIEAGNRDAITYLLLHEATHAVDFTLHLAAYPRPTPFTDGVWTEISAPIPVPAPAYRDPLREQARFYTNAPALTIDKAEAVYESLRKTPFVSLYGGLNVGDDLAEYVTVCHWTQVLNQPYRIVLRNEAKPVYVYEPILSDLVRSRLSQMKRFYEE